MSDDTVAAFCISSNSAGAFRENPEAASGRNGSPAQAGEFVNSILQISDLGLPDPGMEQTLDISGRVAYRRKAVAPRSTLQLMRRASELVKVRGPQEPLECFHSPGKFLHELLDQLHHLGIAGKPASERFGLISFAHVCLPRQEHRHERRFL